jgi:TonB family protein
MLLLAALAVLPVVAFPQNGTSTCECVDHSAELIGSKAEEPTCWKGTKETENEERIEGRPLKVPSRFDKAPIEHTVVMLKLCIDQNGVVRRVLLLKSSGNKELDQYLCQGCGRWRFRPAKVDGRDASSVSHLVVNLRPI